MILAIDRGNTQEKIAVFDKNEIVFFDTVCAFDSAYLCKLLSDYKIDCSVYCSVRNEESNTDFESLFHENKTKIYSAKTLFYFYETKKEKNKTAFDYTFVNNYKTKDTLGEDRLAAIFGAWAKYNKNILVIDAGTCITFDYLDQNGIYQGGSINPGFMMKFRALHNFTANLPLLNSIQEVELCGKTTQECILSGVVNGTLAEIDNMIERYCRTNKDLRVLVTGGDAEFLAKHLQKTVEYAPDILFYGLKNILEINAKEI